MTAEQVSAEELCLYAMHLLDSSETATLDEFLRQSTEARSELERIRGDLALLAFTVQPRVVSPALRQRVLREVAQEAKSTPAAALKGDTHIMDPHLLRAEVADELLAQDSYTPSTLESSVSPDIPLDVASPRGTFLPVWMWAGWALAVTGAVSGGLLHARAHSLQVRLAGSEAKAAHAAEDQRQTAFKADSAAAILDALRSGASQHFVLRPPDAISTMVAHVVYSPERGALIVQASNLQPLATGRTYAVWLYSAQADSKPVMLGTFLPDPLGFATLAVSSLPPGVLASGVGIAVEDKGILPEVPSTMVMTVPR